MENLKAFALLGLLMSVSIVLPPTTGEAIKVKKSSIFLGTSLCASEDPVIKAFKAQTFTQKDSATNIEKAEVTTKALLSAINKYGRIPQTGPCKKQSFGINVKKLAKLAKRSEAASKDFCSISFKAEEIYKNTDLMVGKSSELDHIAGMLYYCAKLEEPQSTERIRVLRRAHTQFEKYFSEHSDKTFRKEYEDTLGLLGKVAPEMEILVNVKYGSKKCKGGYKYYLLKSEISSPEELESYKVALHTIFDPKWRSSKKFQLDHSKRPIGDARKLKVIDSAQFSSLFGEEAKKRLLGIIHTNQRISSKESKLGSQTDEASKWVLRKVNSLRKLKKKLYGKGC